jgi:hypothetical protein
MHARMFGALVARPMKFPGDLEIRLYPLHRHDESEIGGSYPYSDRQSWDWVQKKYAINSEGKERLKAGESIPLYRGMVTTNFPEGTVFPEGSAVEIVEP